MANREIRLGAIASHPIIVSEAVRTAAEHHAANIAASLGLNEIDSSMHAYFDLQQRLRLWSYLFEQLGEERVKQASILEIGSGMGLFVLVGRLLGLHIIGVEPSQDKYDISLGIARRLFNDTNVETTLIQGASEHLPLPSNAFDIVVSFQTLEHVQLLPQTCAEVQRVLVPGGVFFSQFPNYASWYECHYGVFAPLWIGKRATRIALGLQGRQRGFLEHLQWIHSAVAEHTLRNTGFSEVVIQPANGAVHRAVFEQASIEPLPFVAQRGRIAQRSAMLLARAAHRFAHTTDWYPQIEFWARR